MELGGLVQIQYLVPIIDLQRRGIGDRARENILPTLLGGIKYPPLGGAQVVVFSKLMHG